MCGSGEGDGAVGTEEPWGAWFATKLPMGPGVTPSQFFLLGGWHIKEPGGPLGVEALLARVISTWRMRSEVSLYFCPRASGHCPSITRNLGGAEVFRVLCSGGR